MSFNFSILGLFIIYLLMCLCFINRDRKSNSMFNKLLIVNFISQLLYLLSFIVLNKEGDLFIRVYIIKLFMASLVVWPTILFGYTYSKVVRGKYINKDTIYKNKVSFMSKLLVVINLVLVLISFVLPITTMRESVVFGDVISFVYLISLLFIILSLFVMLIYVKNISNKDYLKLYIPLLVSMIVIIIQSCSSKLGIICSGYTFVVLFLYLMLESRDAKVINYLRVAKESAERANIEKTEFLEKLSREIRGPLNTIDGFSQVIMDEDDIDNIKEDAKDIRVASNNLIDMINGIMDISLIESGKMEINNRDYDTMEMLDSVSMMAKSLVNKKKIDFKIEYANNIPRVLSGDSEKIKRILINLFRNAYQYTDKGEIFFNVSCVNANGVCRLIMSVSDTGSGIKKEELNTIFNRYERVVGKSASNGIGLAIVKNLVELMNGKVDVDSVYGKGSTFTITIDQRIIQEESIKVSHDGMRIKMFDASGMRVLVVDDNKLNIKVVSKLLAPYNIEVVEANSGNEFLDIIDKDHNFDLILMDDMMPKMSGTETLGIYRKIERVDGFLIPVVVLTANAISGMRDKYLKVGFDEYLAKPIDKYELNRVLRKFLENKVEKKEKNSKDSGKKIKKTKEEEE